ncbi:hypothetical protein FQN55_000612 [Onygenales sp. PD_40]|nr:hypothetical protein FQN55_000612 [Onygenales sp. PD_40]
MAAGIGHRRQRPARFKLELVSSAPRPCLWVSQETEEDAHTALRAGPPPRKPPHSGILGTLPPEILTTVLMNLDLTTLHDLRLLNTHYKEHIDTLHAYTVLKQHANHTLRIMLRVKIARHFPLSHLWHEFRQPHCRTCGAFGPYVFLPTLTRVCNRCLCTRHEFQVAPLDLMTGRFPFAQEMARELPTVHAFPGVFGGTPLEFFITDEVERLVSVEEAEVAVAALIAHKYGQLVDPERLRRERLGRELRYSTSLMPARLKAGNPGLANWFYEFARTRWMCMGATDLPYWDGKRGMAESGIYCSACTFRREYEKTDEEEKGLWKDMGPLPLGNHVAFYVGDIGGHFENCRFVREGYVFGAKDGLSGGLSNLRDFFISEDGIISLSV